MSEYKYSDWYTNESAQTGASSGDDNSSGADATGFFGTIFGGIKDAVSGYYQVRGLESSLALEQSRIDLIAQQYGATESPAQPIYGPQAIASTNYQQIGLLVAIVGLALAAFVAFGKKNRG